MAYEISVGFYPGILIGFRTYPPKTSNTTHHVLYLPFIDICFTIERGTNE